MRITLIAATVGALALALAACGQRAETTEEAVPAAVAAVEEAVEEVEEAVEEAVEELAEAPLACVKDVPSGSICLMDINACGFSSGCNCGDGYVYNAALGKCLLVLDGVSQATPTPVEDTDCARPTTGICTRDINACGQPSNCRCDDGFVWSDVAGKCLRDLMAPSGTE